MTTQAMALVRTEPPVGVIPPHRTAAANIKKLNEPVRKDCFRTVVVLLTQLNTQFIRLGQD